MKDKDNKKSQDVEDISVGTDSDLDDSVVAEENVLETVKKLRDKLKACETEKQQYMTGWQRAKADLINARKQDEKDKTEFVKFANEMLVHEVLPVFESYEMATHDKEKWQNVDKTWREGVEQIFLQLKKVLEKHGVKEIDPLGEQYDHNVHEAVALAETEKIEEDNKIINVISKGFSMNGKIIKVPKVRVAHLKETKE